MYDLTADTYAVSEMLRLKKPKTMDGVQNNNYIYFLSLVRLRERLK